MFDPAEKEQPIQCSISADLADVYMDLKEALGLEASAADSEDVYWQWHFDFHSHWSRHAASALKALLVLSSRV